MQEREAQLGALADSQARMAAQCDALGEELQAARSQMQALQVRVEPAATCRAVQSLSTHSAQELPRG